MTKVRFRHSIAAGLVWLTLWCAGPARADSLFTVFTGVQDGVDLSGPLGPPPAPLPPGSIVNTVHDPFTLGTDLTATFGGEGLAFHSGVPALYAFVDGGRNFWAVRGDGLGEHVGVITFGDPASFVRLLARGTPAGVVSPPPFLGTLGAADALIRVFSPGGDMLDEIPLANDLPLGFPIDRSNQQLIELTGPIGRIELVNAGAENSFGLIALLQAERVPAPPSAILLGVALIAGAWRWRASRARLRTWIGAEPM